MDIRNPDEKNPSSGKAKRPLNLEINVGDEEMSESTKRSLANLHPFSKDRQPERSPLGLRSDWRPGMPWDPDWGEAPGTKAIEKTKGNPLGKAKRSETLTDLIQMALSEKVDIYYGDGRMERLERRQIWARHLADIAVYGQVVLPSPDQSGTGRVIKFSADSYAKHALKMLRFLEPPVPDVVNPAGVTNIIFDIPIQLPVQITETTSKAPEIVVIDQQPRALDSPENS